MRYEFLKLPQFVLSGTDAILSTCLPIFKQYVIFVALWAREDSLDQSAPPQKIGKNSNMRWSREIGMTRSLDIICILPIYKSPLTFRSNAVFLSVASSTVGEEGPAFVPIVLRNCTGITASCRSKVMVGVAYVSFGALQNFSFHPYSRVTRTATGKVKC